MRKVINETTMGIGELIKEIEVKYPMISINKSDEDVLINVGDSCITISLDKKKYSVKDLRKPGRGNILNLKASDKENYSVVMLLIKLLQKGYSIQSIDLEKGLRVGHKPKYLDVCLTNSVTGEIYMIEVKKNSEIDKYISCNYPDDTKQAISYAFQDKNTKIVSYYTYNFDDHEDEFYSIWLTKEYKESKNVDDFYDIWNQEFDRADYINDNDVFNIKSVCRQYSSLREINESDTKTIFSKFENILRVYSVSDKPNAFMKFINILLCKVNDEVTEDKPFSIKGEDLNIYTFKGLKCQFVDGVDTFESFNIRLNELYKTGMLKYLNKEVIGYSTDEEIKGLLRLGTNDAIAKVIRDLSLKCENPFTFIEVYNQETFEENALILHDMVKIIEGFKFKYDYKQQFLGDFFEKLLNTSLKQEAGQFFTPMPMVDFIVDALPYKEIIQERLVKERFEVDEAIPKIIDYACGSGHFLTSSMYKVQSVINELSNANLDLSSSQKKDLYTYSDISRQYHWVSETNVVGIEKDYRLAKTTKITTYLNGDGRATVLNADGIAPFNSLDYAPCSILFDKNPQKTMNSPSISIEKFDFVISNPPYSVKGFIKNLTRNGILKKDNNFSLYTDDYNENDTRIETIFVERAWQLLKDNGIAALILPQSILSSDKYMDLRRFIFDHFELRGMTLTSDNTFSGTSTSPVILFMIKRQSIRSQFNNEIVIVMSPKYKNPKGSINMEREWLGYTFSDNRNISGITTLPNSEMRGLSKYIRDSLVDNPIIINQRDKEYVTLVRLSDIVLGNEKMIYPKYRKISKTPIGNIFDVNSRSLGDFPTPPTKYIEIGNIKNGKIVEIGLKNKSSSRLCKKGDILLSSLCPTGDKIAVAMDDYMVSSAIHVLTPKQNVDIGEMLNKLRSKEVLEQMNNLLDGFKVTYAKISEENLKDNVRI